MNENVDKIISSKQQTKDKNITNYMDKNGITNR